MSFSDRPVKSLSIFCLRVDDIDMSTKIDLAVYILYVEKMVLNSLGAGVILLPLSSPHDSLHRGGTQYFFLTK